MPDRPYVVPSEGQPEGRRQGNGRRVGWSDEGSVWRCELGEGCARCGLVCVVVWIGAVGFATWSELPPPLYDYMPDSEQWKVLRTGFAFALIPPPFILMQVTVFVWVFRGFRDVN